MRRYRDVRGTGAAELFAGMDATGPAHSEAAEHAAEADAGLQTVENEPAPKKVPPPVARKPQAPAPAADEPVQLRAVRGRLAWGGGLWWLVCLWLFLVCFSPTMG